MGTPIDREGDFRVKVAEAAVRKEDSGAIGIGIKFQVLEAKAGDEWQDWREYDVEVDGVFYVMKKDGTAIERTIGDLVNHLGWDGSFVSIEQGSFALNAPDCQVNVGSETYKDKARFRANWINGWDYEGRGLGNVNSTAAAELDMQLGAKMRAMGAGAKQPAPPAPPTGSRPVTPPAGPPATAVATSTDVAVADPQGKCGTKDAAWARWVDVSPNDTPDVPAWNEAVKAIGKPEAEFTADDWDIVANAEIPL